MYKIYIFNPYGEQCQCQVNPNHGALISNYTTRSTTSAFCFIQLLLLNLLTQWYPSCKHFTLLNNKSHTSMGTFSKSTSLMK